MSMAGNGGFGDDPLVPGCYSQLLYAEEIRALEMEACFLGFPPSDDNTHSPKMLCFGDYANQSDVKAVVDNLSEPGQRSGITCTDSCSLKISSTNDAALPKSNNKKRVGSGVEYPGAQPGAPSGSQRNVKKGRTDGSTVTGGHAKVAKKEKLGERITGLQQLVSPFGKTDTASVLHEALGYIRFLQDQVQVLCSPYLQRAPLTSPTLVTPDNEGGSGESERSRDDLRSRGLCLVPVELTLHVAESNGADLWSPAAMIGDISSSR